MRSAVPNYFQIQEPPCISYKYTKPIVPNIFNYSTAVKEFDWGNYTNGGYSCDYESSMFKYDKCGHVLTGDLDIVGNEDLKNLLLRGPKYREQRSINLKSDQRIILSAVEDYIKRWSKREKADPSVLDDWFELVKQKIGDSIRHINTGALQKPNEILKDPTVQEVLAELHRKYVAVPADKAPNNIIFVCKYYYYKVIVEELVPASAPATHYTYSETTTSVEDILKKHTAYLKTTDINTPSHHSDIPQLYWIPKMHKCPYKARFIAGSRNCTTKPLSILLTRALQEVKSYWDKYCCAIRKNSDVNCMWILNNSKRLTEELDAKCNIPYENISTWDFSTLYTTIPHTDLIELRRNILTPEMKLNPVNDIVWG